MSSFLAALGCMGLPPPDLKRSTALFDPAYFGTKDKLLSVDMICFQQRATAYLKCYKDHKMYLPEQVRMVSTKGDVELAKVEEQLAKYLDRLFDIVEIKHPKTSGMGEQAVFAELQKVVESQLSLEITDDARKQLDDFIKLSPEQQDMTTLNVITGVPLVDIIINIDWFTAHFEDRNKLIRIFKNLFNNCASMKQLLAKHDKLIMTVLMSKYDKQCHLFMNKAGSGRKSYNGVDDSKLARQLSTDAASANHLSGQNHEYSQRDEFLAVIIGQLIRLYAKSKTLSRVFQNFELICRLANLCKHDQFIIQSDAQKTLESIMLGHRIIAAPDPNNIDSFLQWIENNQDDTFDQFNQLFLHMRQSDIYAYKRLSMKLQYEILSVGLKQSIELINQKYNKMQVLSEAQKKQIDKASDSWPYYKFASYFADDKQNLRDIMKQLLEVSDDEIRIKEELFHLLSVFIATYENRNEKVRRDLYCNRVKLTKLMQEFREIAERNEEEESVELMDELMKKLKRIYFDEEEMNASRTATVSRVRE